MDEREDILSSKPNTCDKHLDTICFVYSGSLPL